LKKKLNFKEVINELKKLKSTAFPILLLTSGLGYGVYNKLK